MNQRQSHIRLPSNPPAITAVGTPAVIKYQILGYGRILFRIRAEIGIIQHCNYSRSTGCNQAKPADAEPFPYFIFFSLHHNTVAYI